MYQKTYSLAANDQFTGLSPMDGSEAVHYVSIEGAAQVDFYMPGQSTPYQTVTSNAVVKGIGISKVDITETSTTNPAVVVLSGG